jgi:TetR/AcrR family transcriptional regulator, cholesterol catabolism regulator
VVQIPTAPPKPPKSDAKRAEILRRAAAAFRDEGFHAAGMRAIARAAGMTPGNLYYYFENKDDLLYACQTQTLERLLRDARAIAAGAAEPEARLRALVRAHVLCLLEETGGSAAHLEFRALAAARRVEIAKKRDAYERVVRGVVVEGVRCGSFRSLDAKLATLAILGALNATVTWWRPEGPLTPAAIADAFADTLVGGLLR